jgi:salicylate hydroxylase
MHPFMGQGAAMAIEDGATLAACLVAAGTGDPAETLRHYERLRLPRVTRLQEMSRANKTRFHMRDGSAQQARDAEWATAGDRSPDTLRWLYDFNVAVIEPMSAPTTALGWDFRERKGSHADIRISRSDSGRS